MTSEHEKWERLTYEDVKTAYQAGQCTVPRKNVGDYLQDLVIAGALTAPIVGAAMYAENAENAEKIAEKPALTRQDTS